VIFIINVDVQRRIRRRKIRFRIFFIISLISLLGIYLFNNPVIKANRVIVNGNSIISTEKIIDLSGIKNGDNLLHLNLKQINKKLSLNPYVEKSKVRWTISGNVYIEIEERNAAAIVKYGSKYVTMDKKGVIIEILDKIDDIKLPIVNGLDIKSAVSGNIVELSDIRKLNALKIIFDSLTKCNLFDIISEIDVNNLVTIIIKSKYNIDLKIGDIDDIDNKLKRCSIIIEQDLKKKGQKGTLDVSFKGNPVFEPSQQ
jgi:cell division septal protein FtsQ